MSRPPARWRRLVFANVKSKLTVLAVSLGALAFTGAIAERIAAPVWSARRASEPALQIDSATAAAGQGVTLGLLGGFRAIVADFAWIRLYVSWEARDLPATETIINLVTSLDPRPLYFWLNGARMMAYDMPVWRIESEGGYDAVPQARQDAISHEQARLALRRIEAAMRFHSTSAALWTERANIEWNRLGDAAAAAESYGRAWEQPEAPYFTARLHAEMLRRIGRKAEALAWLVKLHPLLPPADESARAVLVLERIRQLEGELGVPPEQRYAPPREIPALNRK